MIRSSTVVSASCLAVIASALSGCAAVPRVLSLLHLRSSTPALAVRPVETASLKRPQVTLDDRLYGDAKAAIEVRDYSRALDLLQFAKQQNPKDGRILNALGV